MGLKFLDTGLTLQPSVTDSPGVTNGSRSDQDIGHSLKDLSNPSWATFHVTGDEAKEGPIHNYARVFTWWKFSTVIEKAFEALIINLRGQKNCRNEDWISDSSLEINLSGTADDVSRFCGLDKANLDAYSDWKDIGSNVWHQIAIAAAVAVWVQWGTTGKQKPDLVAYEVIIIIPNRRSNSRGFFNANEGELFKRSPSINHAI